jgi:hypothetical protein
VGKVHIFFRFFYCERIKNLEVCRRKKAKYTLILSVIMKQDTNSPRLLSLDMKIFLAWGTV